MNDLRSVDLNLLVILDALLDEAHVTRAASRLNLSQPATSSALDRLRNLYGDPLLQRGVGGMELTPTARTLQKPVKEILGAITATLRKSKTHLSNTQQTVRLVMADNPAVKIISDLHAKLSVSAPGVNLAVLPWHGAVDTVVQVMKGDVDLIVSAIPQTDTSLRQKILLNERYVVAMRHGHPAAQKFSLANWLAYPHLIVSGSGAMTTSVDMELAAQGLSRRVSIVVPSFLMAPPLLLQSNLIALLPSRCIPQDARNALLTFDPPIKIEDFRLYLAWHRRSDDDLVIQHVIQQMSLMEKEKRSVLKTKQRKTPS